MYIAPANGCPVVPVITAKLKQLDAQRKKLTPQEQQTLGAWHMVGGAALFMAEAGGELGKNYLEQEREAIQNTLKQIAALGKKANAAQQSGDITELMKLKVQIASQGEELDKNTKALVKAMTYKRMITQDTFTEATTVPWRAEILDLKQAEVDPKVIATKLGGLCFLAAIIFYLLSLYL